VVRRETLIRRELGHDIRHELGTIMVLASVLARSDDLNATSRARVGQILAETRWLEQLLSAYEQEVLVPPTRDGSSTRLDLVAADILRPIRLGRRTHVELDATEVSAYVDRLALWRLLRNIVCNAVDAAGEQGRVMIRVYRAGGQAIVEVDDDGPGFDPNRAAGSSLGLMIVNQLVEHSRGQLTIGRGTFDGCGVRLAFVADEPAEANARRRGMDAG